jgi:purine-nucleoside phosphorylase
MLHLANQIAETAAFVRDRWSATPKAGVILGSGLGEFVERDRTPPPTFPYADLPHFPHTTAIGHAGRLVCGTLGGAPLIAFQGRFPPLRRPLVLQTASLPVRLLAALGGRTLDRLQRRRRAQPAVRHRRRDADRRPDQPHVP